MVRTTFTIYKLDTNESNQNIIDEFNEDKEDDKQFKVKNNKHHNYFKHINHYEVYTRNANTKPEWGKVLKNIVEEIEVVENNNNSFILFIDIAENRFAITGGEGYSVLQKYKDYEFGLDVLTRLVDSNEKIINRLNNRFMVGNIIGGATQYNQAISFDEGSDFNQYLKELQINLPSIKIQQKLGVKVTTAKNSYRLLARDSIKLGKSLNLEELDELLYRVVKLLKKERPYVINRVFPLDKQNPIIKELNRSVVDKIRHIIEKNEYDQSDLKIIPFYQVLDKHIIRTSKSNSENYESEEDILTFVEKNVSFDKEQDDLVRIFQNKVELIAMQENEELFTRSFFEHLDITLKKGKRFYWLIDGIWYFIEQSYISEINELFVSNVTNPFNHNFKLSKLRKWIDTKNESEGQYNFYHNSIDSVYVLDKILFENIEICDLLVEKEDKLYFIHVKNKLDGDIRVLAAQLEQSMQTVSSALTSDESVLKGYYESIENKLKSDDEEETSISQSARKFIDRFQTYEEFTKVIESKQIVFVFAYRPIDSYDLNNPTTITSTAAKMSMIELTRNISRYSDRFKLEFMRIETA